MKVVYGVVLAVMLASCSPFGLNPMGYKVLHEDLDVAWKRVSSMEYIKETNGNYWKSPTEFFNDGGGDCEDFAIALIYLLGPKANLVCISWSDKVHHAIVQYNNIYLEPQVFNMYYSINTITIEIIYNYDDTLCFATDYGRKSL
jgi:hypothetical protein